MARRTAIRALTVPQPWAWAIATGRCLLDGTARTVSMHAIGERLALYAPDDGMIDHADVAAVAELAGVDVDQVDRLLVFGAVIAVVELRGVLVDRGQAPAPQRAWWRRGPSLLLAEVAPLRTPVWIESPAVGIWTLPVPESDRVVAAVRELANVR